MCDYSLHAVASRPAKVGETLISAGTRGFAAETEPEVAVCLLPGTELAFAASSFHIGVSHEVERQRVAMVLKLL